MRVETERSVKDYIDFGMSELYDDEGSDKFEQQKKKAYEYGKWFSFRVAENKAPKIQAAGCVYTSGLRVVGRRKTQEEVAEVFDTTIQSISSVMRYLANDYIN